MTDLLDQSFVKEKLSHNTVVLVEAEESNERDRGLVTDINIWGRSLEGLEKEIEPFLEEKVDSPDRDYLNRMKMSLLRVMNEGFRARGLFYLSLLESEKSLPSSRVIDDLEADLMISDILKESTPEDIELPSYKELRERVREGEEVGDINNERITEIRARLRSSFEPIPQQKDFGDSRQIVATYPELLEMTVRAERESHDFVAGAGVIVNILDSSREAGTYLNSDNKRDQVWEQMSQTSRIIDFGYVNSLENLYPRERVELQEAVAIINGQLDPFRELLNIQKSQVPIEISEDLLDWDTKLVVDWSKDWIERLVTAIGTNYEKKYRGTDPSTIKGRVNIGVSIGLSNDKRSLVITFSDNMGGFPDEIKQAGTYTGLTEWPNGIEGTGVGMKAQKDVIEKVYGGKVTVRETRDEQGNTVAQTIVEIPINS